MKILFLLCFMISKLEFKTNNVKIKTKLNNNEKQNIIHFIKCGHADSILVEGEGHFGLIDSANH